jgi:hypothetical protein
LGDWQLTQAPQPAQPLQKIAPHPHSRPPPALQDGKYNVRYEARGIKAKGSYKREWQRPAKQAGGLLAVWGAIGKLYCRASLASQPPCPCLILRAPTRCAAAVKNIQTRFIDVFGSTYV